MFEPQKLKATTIATNYKYENNSLFSEKILNLKKFQKYQIQEAPMRMKVNGNIQEDLTFFQHLELTLPKVFTSKTSGIVFIIEPSPDNKLQIIKDQYSPQDDFDVFREITQDLIDLKLSDINALGINFSAEFNLGKKKLQLLNKKVESIKDFENNLTFEFVLPIEYKDEGLIATYRIKKIRGGGNTGEDRFYEINTNFHFDLSELSTNEKMDKVSRILSKNFYQMYIEKVEEFLSLE